MTLGTSTRGLLRAPLAAVAAVLVSGPAFAQAIITPRGEGAVTLSHQFAESSVHLDRVGKSADLGRETLHVAVGDVEYGVTDRLSAEVSLVWLATQWIGDVRDRHGPLDTGVFHGSLQDMRVAVRYQLVEGAVNVAPFAAFGGPVTDYESRGHSAFGRHLEEFTLGASAGGPVLRRFYWQTTASYAAVNDIDSEDFNLDHANGDVEMGVALGARATLRAFGTGQWMWDGLKVGPQTDHFHLRLDHDRFTQSSFVNIGAGATVDLGPRVTLGVTGFRTVAGRNFHAMNVLATSVTWTFGGGFTIAPPRFEPPGR